MARTLALAPVAVPAAPLADPLSLSGRSALGVEGLPVIGRSAQAVPGGATLCQADPASPLFVPTATMQLQSLSHSVHAVPAVPE